MFDYEAIPLHWVHRLGILTRQKLSALFGAAHHDISPEEWAVMLVLWKKGSQTPSALADVTFKDRTTVTRLIDAMVRKNLVTRTPDLNDRRKTVVDLSEQGSALEANLVPLAQTLIEQALNGLSDEDIETTTRTLRIMTKNLSAATPPVAKRRKAGI